MSVAAMAAVKRHAEAKAGPLLLELMLSDYADDCGVAWPGVERLANDCRVDRTTVMRQLAKLEEWGDVAVLRWTGAHNVYVLLLPGLEKPSDEDVERYRIHLGDERTSGIMRLVAPVRRVPVAPMRPEPLAEPPGDTPSPDGEGVVASEANQGNLLQKRHLSQAELLADAHAERVVRAVTGGRAFNLTAELEEVWTRAWQDAEQRGLNPKAVGIRLLGHFYEAMTDRPPTSEDYARLGALVGRWGKLALWGLDEALSRNIADYLPYAQQVCKRQDTEYRARQATARATAAGEEAAGGV